MTGYAKDYVGQLCREGRVPARLIGRNWYVLESAIEDHRFGPEEKASKTKESKVETAGATTDTWPISHYESAELAHIPSINRLAMPSQKKESVYEQPKPVEEMGSVWKEWFVQASGASEAAQEQIEVVESEPEQPEVVTEEEIESESVEVNVPLRTVQHAPAAPSEEIEDEEEEVVAPPRSMFIPKLVATALAIIFLVLFAANSGYLDTFIGSSQQASIFTGISTYSK